MEILKVTPFNAIHQALGGRMVDFGGWEMPVQYSGVIVEHNAVRTKCGLFDVSHMGEVTAKGPNAFDFVQNLITNNAEKLEPGKVIYTPMCYDDGGIVDDLLVYMKSREDFYLVVNASNADKDFAWMQDNTMGAELKNISDATAELALQGPLAEGILQKITGYPLAEMGFFHFAEFEIAGAQMLVSRTGYTGEDGFELYFAPEHAEKVWAVIMGAGDVTPCGLGARDSLRLEAGLMLYGNDIDKTITPLEAPLQWTVDLGKDFVGCKALKEKPITRKLVGFELLDKGVPRHGNPVVIGGEEKGVVTSGTFSPTFRKPIGFCLIPVETEGNVQVRIHDKLVEAKLCSHRFYKRQKN